MARSDSAIVVGRRVSARRGPFLPLLPGQRRAQRARKYGNTVESVDAHTWKVQWDDGVVSIEKSATLRVEMHTITGLKQAEIECMQSSVECMQCISCFKSAAKGNVSNQQNALINFYFYNFYFRKILLVAISPPRSFYYYGSLMLVRHVAPAFHILSFLLPSHSGPAAAALTQ